MTVLKLQARLQLHPLMRPINFQHHWLMMLFENMLPSD
jgi:hypothetical protein